MSKTHRRSSFLASTPSNSGKSSEMDFWQDLEGREWAAAEAQCDLMESEGQTGLVRVRAATRTQLQNDLSVARAEVEREFKAVFLREQRKYREEIEKLRENCDNARMVAIGKDAELGKLRGIIAEQEVVITALRTGVIVGGENPKSHSDIHKNSENVDYLRAETHSLLEKVSAFGEITKILRGENGELQEKLSESREDLKETIENYEEKLKCQVESYESRLESAGNKYESLFHEYFLPSFESYKNDTERELEVCEALRARQNVAIVQLQEQLRVARSLLQSPRAGSKERLFVSVSPKAASSRGRFPISLRTTAPSAPQLPRYPVKVIDLNRQRLARTLERSLLASREAI